MQDSCTVDKLKMEIGRLERLLSDKEDLVLATRRVALDKVTFCSKYNISAESFLANGYFSAT